MFDPSYKINYNGLGKKQNKTIALGIQLLELYSRVPKKVDILKETREVYWTQTVRAGVCYVK